MKKTIIVCLILFVLFLSACEKASYKDCGTDKDCVVSSLLEGEKAMATITETEQQGDFTTTAKAMIKSEGRDGDKVVVYQEILQLDVDMPELPPLPSGASEEEKQQYELSKQVVSAFAKNFESLERTSLKCSLDPAKVEVQGIDEVINQAMQESIDPLTLQPSTTGPCAGSMLDAFANIMTQMMQLLTQAIAQAGTDMSLE